MISRNFYSKYVECCIQVLCELLLVVYIVEAVILHPALSRKLDK